MASRSEVKLFESSYFLPQAIDPASGRLDALRLARYLELNMDDMAAILRRPQHEVQANASAADLQDILKAVVFIAAGLLELTGGSKEQMLIWLAAPHPVLDDKAPIDLMREGELSVIVGVVDDMLSGAPA